MMDELRKEFIDNCTLDGILDRSFPLLGKKYSNVIKCLLLLLVFILYFISYNVSSLILGYGFTLNVMNAFNFKNENIKFLALIIMIMILAVVLILICAFYYIQNKTLSILNENYNSLMRVYRKLNDLDSLNISFVTTLWDFDNHYHKFVKFILQENQLKFENEYLRKKGVKFINEIIKYNNQDIRELENKINTIPNKSFYAFIGGLIANNVIGFVFNTIESFESLNIEARIIIAGSIIISIILVGQFIVNIFNFINIDIINGSFKRKCEYLKEFNKYLINIVLKY